MDYNSLPIDKVMLIARIEYLILNLYKDPDAMAKEMYRLIDEHKISEIKDTMTYFYEMLYFRGYAEYAEEFARKYNIPQEENS